MPNVENFPSQEDEEKMNTEKQEFLNKLKEAVDELKEKFGGPDFDRQAAERALLEMIQKDLEEQWEKKVK